MDIETRPAASSDVPGIRFVGYSTWPPTYGRICGPGWVVQGLDRYWAEALVQAAVGAGSMDVATVDGATVGVSEVGEFEDWFMMWKLYVIPGFQHEGVGTALLGAVRRRAARQGRVLHTEYVAANGRAGGFYRFHGFVPTGAHHHRAPWTPSGCATHDPDGRPRPSRAPNVAPISVQRPDRGRSPMRATLRSSEFGPGRPRRTTDRAPDAARADAMSRPRARTSRIAIPRRCAPHRLHRDPVRHAERPPRASVRCGRSDDGS